MGTTRPVRRILVEPSAYHLLNLGDVAMLQVAVRRLATLWPAARIDVFTDVPQRLARLCPEATAVPARGRNAYLTAPPPGDWLWRSVPAAALRTAQRLRLAVRRHTLPDGAMEVFAGAVRDADLVVVSGGGGTADVFPWETHTVLDLLDLANAAAVPTAMTGQAFGPLHSPALRRRARAVLPAVDLIALRERRASEPLLRSLGVPMDRVVTTGDDAIAVASALRSDRVPERLIGMNVRIAPYSGLDPAVAAEIGGVVRRAADLHRAGVVSVPISIHPEEADAAVTGEAIGASVDGDGVDTPEDAVARIGRCRLLVTGSYHAAVFALALGIPAIGLAWSPYYVDKFCGLADQFGVGCAVVQSASGWRERLAAAIETLWEQADALREPLTEAADRQIALGEAAYLRLRDIVERR